MSILGPVGTVIAWFFYGITMILQYFVVGLQLH